MSLAGALPYSKILPYVIFTATYFGMTGASTGQPTAELKTVVLKLLPIITLIFMVRSCVSRNTEHGQLKKYILVGFLFSIVGDVFMVWKVHLFIPGLLVFAVAQVLYTYAYGMYPFGGIVTCVVLYMTGGYIFIYLSDAIHDPVMTFLIFLYTFLITTMGWRTAVRMSQNFNLGSVCAFVGAVMFITSDTMIAIDKFKGPIPDASFWVMITYFLAQLGIALSACYDPQLPNVGVVEKSKAT